MENSEHLLLVEETGDLSIWMDSTIKFSMQCSKAANKAMQPLERIKRTSTLLHSFIQNVHQASLGILHISSEFILAKGIDTIEKVQPHRYTKLVTALADLPYKDRLKHLDLYSLYCKRQYADLITIYQLSNRKFKLILTLDTFTTTCGHDFKPYKTQTRLCLRHNFFIEQFATL